MSTWTGINGGNPESTTYTTCSWSMCSMFVPQRFQDAGMLMCREHALLVWVIVNEQLGLGETFEPEFGEPLGVFKDRTASITSGYVYYIRTGGRIKIGYTTNLWRRLSQYPPDTELLYVRTGTKQLERSEHHRFRAYLADGREWFQDREEVTEPIREQAEASKSWRELAPEDWWRRRRATNTLTVSKKPQGARK